jgi:hypothetical protein
VVVGLGAAHERPNPAHTVSQDARVVELTPPLHLPEPQLVLVGHARPQAPQFWFSPWRSAHVPAQIARPWLGLPHWSWMVNDRMVDCPA